MNRLQTHRAHNYSPTLRPHLLAWLPCHLHVVENLRAAKTTFSKWQVVVYRRCLPANELVGNRLVALPDVAHCALDDVSADALGKEHGGLSQSDCPSSQEGGQQEEKREGRGRLGHQRQPKNCPVSQTPGRIFNVTTPNTMLISRMTTQSSHPPLKTCAHLTTELEVCQRCVLVRRTCEAEGLVGRRGSEGGRETPPRSPR